MFFPGVVDATFPNSEEDAVPIASEPNTIFFMASLRGLDEVDIEINVWVKVVKVFVIAIHKIVNRVF